MPLSSPVKRTRFNVLLGGKTNRVTVECKKAKPASRLNARTKAALGFQSSRAERCHPRGSNYSYCDGSFKPAQAYPIIQHDGGPAGAPEVAVADFNGDHKMDIAILNPNNKSVDVLLGNGDGTFGRGATLNFPDFPLAIVAGDFRRNGKIDLAVASVLSFDYTQPGKVSVFLGNGNGTFAEPPKVTLMGFNPRSIGAADFDEDGNLDLVATSGNRYGPQKVQVLFGKGDGTFAKTLDLAVASNPNRPGCWSIYKKSTFRFCSIGEHPHRSYSLRRQW